MALDAGGEAHRRRADCVVGVIEAGRPKACRAKPSLVARLRVFWLAAGCLASALLSGPASASARPMLGANVDLSALSPTERKLMLDRLAAAGVTSIRMQLDWNKVEPSSGKFAWGGFDAAVDAARSRRMDVVLVLGPCATWAVDPAWEVPPDQRCRSVPRSLDIWRRYVKTAVSHFRGRVSHWQVREQPSASNFRGARSEYLALLGAAAEAARSVDRAARIIAPESGCLDLAGTDQLIHSRSSQSVDVIGLYVPADACRSLLPWAVLAHEILAGCDAGQRRPVWVLGSGDPPATAEAWRIHYLLAWASGVERCYLPAAPIDEAWTRPLAELEYAGFVALGPGAWAFVFSGKDGPVTIAWSAAKTEVLVPGGLPTAGGPPVGARQVARSAEGRPSPRPAEPDPGVPAEQTCEGTADDSGTTSAVEGKSQPPVTVEIGPCPALVSGVDWAGRLRPGAPTRADVFAVPESGNLSLLPLVYVDPTMPAHPETGLHQMALRGGEVVKEQHAGRHCLRTCIAFREADEERDNPWMYFDVDDGWLYFDRGRTRLAITVECERSYLGKEKLGFNLLYDSTTGYRFTPWQWVEPGDGWRCYRFEVDDASFSNRDGWDFRINAKGSKQDLWVSAVMVEKLPARPGGTGISASRQELSPRAGVPGKTPVGERAGAKPAR